MSRWIGALCINVLLTGCTTLPSRGGAPQHLNNPITASAEVKHLEEHWVVAWNNRDYSFMEDILAPEFVLVSSGGVEGNTFNNREGWLRNARGMSNLPFKATVISVVVAGDTAVATLEARWRRDSVLTDTWLKRNGRWQIIFRHSTPRHSGDAAISMQQ